MMVIMVKYQYMYPDQSQYSIDYLNQIAPQQKKPGMANKMIVIIFLILGVLAVIIGALALVNSASTPQKDVTTLALRLQNLQAVTNGATKNISNGDLRVANSNLALFLTNTNREIATPLANNNVDPKKADKSLIKGETERTTKITEALTDALLNVRYDTTYAAQMNYELNLLVVLMKKIQSQTNSESLKSFIATTLKDLTPIHKQISDYVTSTTPRAG